MNDTFASNNQLKLLKKLQMRKYRKKEQLFIAEGTRCVEQLLTNGFIHVKEVYIDNSLSKDFAFIPGHIPVYATDAGTLADVSNTESTQGILALCEIPKEKAVPDIAKMRGTIVAMDAIQDPGNAGTIIRTAAWFGSVAVLSGSGTVDTYHPKVVRSTAGATGALPMINGDLTELLPVFDASGWSILLLDGGQHSVNIGTIQKNDRQILVIGNEGNGIQDSVLELGYPCVRIPGQSSVVESLNAAIACSIGLYELSG